MDELFRFAKVHLFFILPKKNVTLHSFLYFMNSNKDHNINAIEQNTIVTIGMFDGLHIGHQHILDMLLREAKNENLHPVVVTFDLHPRLVLGKTDGQFRLLTTQQERQQMLTLYGIDTIDWIHFTPQEAQLSACDFVRQHLIERLHARAIVLGYDNQFGNKQHNDFDRLPELARQEGVKLFYDTPVILDGIEVSSTQIRNALRQGDLPMANQMLGAPYAITGTVVHGRQVGRTLGFPTANIELNDNHKALPLEGVYAVDVLLNDGTTHRGMVNIGPQPTFQQATPTIEVHILNYQHNLYGKPLTLRFLQRLRDIQQFSSAHDLQQQLQHDMDITANL